jgi:low temperature requirement protein LtrA
MRSLLRGKTGHGHHRVTSIELFFDLVFVFAVTQLSHYLLHDFTAMGALHTGLLMMAVWWAWMYTSWATNWLDPDRIPVRVVLLACMLIGLLLSASIPAAFHARGLTFAAAYVAIQVGRTSFVWWAMRHHQTHSRNFLRIVIWFLASGTLWIGGGLVDGEQRLALWAIALLLDYLAPSAYFWVPGLGASATEDWDVDGGHMAERCGLFIIIALGESILVTGATFADLMWTTETTTALVASFVGSIAMWWLYFDTTADAASETIAASADPGRLARSAYTYLHLPIVAGIIVAAVGDELVLAHPGGHVEATTIISVVGGPVIYLAGTVLFRWAITRSFSMSNALGILALGILVPVAPTLTPLTLATASTLILVCIALWDGLNDRPAGARGLPVSM